MMVSFLNTLVFDEYLYCRPKLIPIDRAFNLKYP